MLSSPVPGSEELTHDTGVDRTSGNAMQSPGHASSNMYASSECTDFRSPTLEAEPISSQEQHSKRPLSIFGGPSSPSSFGMVSPCSSNLRSTAKRLTFNDVSCTNVGESSNVLALQLVEDLLQEERVPIDLSDDDECDLHDDSSSDREIIDLDESDADSAHRWSPMAGMQSRALQIYQPVDDNVKVKKDVEDPTNEESDDDAGMGFRSRERDYSKYVRRGSVAHQTEQHERKVQNAFSHLKCDCRFKAPGDQNCLEQHFTRPQLRHLHSLVFGNESVSPGAANPNKLSIKDVKYAIHCIYWELREPLSEPSTSDKKHINRIPNYKLNGKVVCKKVFQEAVGGSDFAHRMALSMTLQGVHPNEVRGSQAAQKVVQHMKARHSSKTSWAISWWKRHLTYQDFLPNECKIQYRGPSWTDVHKSLYVPEATTLNLVLKKSQWIRARAGALQQLQRELYELNDPRLEKLKSTFVDKEVKLTVTRSARHSKFPECKECQQLRTEYQKVASKLSAAKEVVKQRYDALVAHTQEWQLDREVACDIRQRCSSCEYDAIYEVDDKCGSYWQRLPVSDSGRDHKDNAKAVYRFSIQANVVCGQQGIQRFTIVPKNVKVGSNFGLTNLIMTILHVKKTGRLQPYVTHLYRHTDGGPDNVSIATHFVHWLLVYLGVFQKITWFRFKAGHSHTETADRLFALLKRHFESDSRHRVTGMSSFVELTNKVWSEFENTCEGSAIAWDFANWDFRLYTTELCVVSKKLKGVTTKRVYRYTYDEKLWKHGCVLVQYKENIAFKGNSVEAEWAPIATIEEEMPTADGEGVEMRKRNVSVPTGVRFVFRPPDLRVSIRREPWEKDDFSPAQRIAYLLARRQNDMSADALKSWKFLQRLHGSAQNSATFPKMPHKVSDPDAPELEPVEFQGSPMDFKEAMKELMRFPRPMLPDISEVFNTEPPANWEEAHSRMEQRRSNNEEEVAESQKRGSKEPLRDPRRVNDVEHLDNTGAPRNRDKRAVDEEDFANQAERGVEKVLIGDLYLLELEQAEHGIRLGLGKVDSLEPGTSRSKEDTWKVLWFCSINGWGKKNAKFKKWEVNGRREQDSFSIEYFRLHVQKKDMTRLGWQCRNEAPVLTSVFVKKVMAFARRKKLLAGGAAQQPDGNDEEEGSSTNDEDSDEDSDDSSSDEHVLQRGAPAAVDSSDDSDDSDMNSASPQDNDDSGTAESDVQDSERGNVRVEERPVRKRAAHEQARRRNVVPRSDEEDSSSDQEGEEASKRATAPNVSQQQVASRSRKAGRQQAVHRSRQDAHDEDSSEEERVAKAARRTSSTEQGAQTTTRYAAWVVKHNPT